MNQAVQKSGRKPLIIVLCIVVALLVIIGIVFGLALSDPNPPIVPGTKASAGTAKLVAAVATGVPAHLSAEEVNDILAEKLAKSKGTKVLGVRLTVNSDQTVNAYMPVNYKGVRFGLNANLTLVSAEENTIAARVNSVQIGRLPANKGWTLSLLQKKLPKQVSLDGDVLRLNTQMLDTYLLQDIVGININSLSTEDQGFVIGVSGNFDKLKDYIQEHLKSYIGLLG